MRTGGFMKYYNPSKLFIAKMGYVSQVTKTGGKYNHFNEVGLGFFEQHKDFDYKYIDILSNIKYVSFHDWHCESGDNAILSPINLLTFIQKNYNSLIKYKFLKQTINNILIGKSLNEAQLRIFLLIFNNENILELPTKNKKTNLKIYTNLYKKKYKLQPCFERNKELSELLYALPEKNTTPILVGEHGTGKTTIVDGLMYRIQKKIVPVFLWKQKIIELDIANLIASENKEQKLIDLISYCIKNNVILFIDDIEKLIEYELYDIVKESVKRKNLKTISSTTIDNYNKYFLNDDFTKISIDEPSNEELDKIIRGVIDNYSKETKVIYNKEDLNIVIYTLIDITNIKNRNINTNNKDEDNKSCNPYLVIKIIDKMFSHAIANEQKELSLDNLIYAINSCDKINNKTKEDYFNQIHQNVYKKMN